MKMLPASSLSKTISHGVLKVLLMLFGHSGLTNILTTSVLGPSAKEMEQSYQAIRQMMKHASKVSPSSNRTQCVVEPEVGSWECHHLTTQLLWHFRELYPFKTQWTARCMWDTFVGVHYFIKTRHNDDVTSQNGFLVLVNSWIFGILHFCILLVIKTGQWTEIRQESYCG